MKFICIKCGKRTSKIKGSMKHPYCGKCFKEEFNSIDDYFEFLRGTHP